MVPDDVRWWLANRDWFGCTRARRIIRRALFPQSALGIALRVTLLTALGVAACFFLYAFFVGMFGGKL